MSKTPVFDISNLVEDDSFQFVFAIKNENYYTEFLHSHEHIQMCYIQHGTCLHVLPDKQCTLVKGDIFVIPPYHEHNIMPLENRSFTCVEINFKPQFINENMTDPSIMNSFVDYAYIQPFIEQDKEFLPKLNLPTPEQYKVEQLISNINNELETKEDGYKLSIKADLLKLLILVGREYKKFIERGTNVQIIKKYRNSFDEAVKYIETCYNTNISLEKAAAKACMSPSYFSHIFKMIKGQTFIEYLNNVRIREAMELLKNTDMNITEISFEAGFGNLGHFNRMFKRIAGTTPKEYRKQVQSR